VANLREMPAEVASKLLCRSIGLLACEALIVCVLVFQSAWANSWPVGISKHDIFASFMTGMAVLVLLTAEAAVLVPIGFEAEQVFRRPYVAWGSFLILMTVALIVDVAVSPRVFGAIRAAIAADWP
jgi:hypothetical protein